MGNTNSIRIDLGYGDYIYITKTELFAYGAILKAVKALRDEGFTKGFSSTRLIKKAFELRENSYVTEAKIRRMIWVLIAKKPRVLHMRQMKRFRLISPTANALKSSPILREN